MRGESAPTSLLNADENITNPTQEPSVSRSLTFTKRRGSFLFRSSHRVDPPRNSDDKDARVDTLSSDQVRLNLRVRSDSALASMRRRQNADQRETEEGMDADQSKESKCKPRKPRQRTSLGVVQLGPQFGLHHKRREGFFDVFGILGLPMLLFFLATSLAVLNQALIQIIPTEYANFLMNTAHFDNGEFWMLPDAEPVPTVVATALLVFFAACYVYLAAFMVLFRHKALVRKRDEAVASQGKIDSMSRAGRVRSAPRLPELSSIQLFRVIVPALLWPSRVERSVIDVPQDSHSEAKYVSFRNNVVPFGDMPVKSKKKGRVGRQTGTKIPVREIYAQFSNPNGVYHAYYNVLYDTPKLVLQSITLLAYLRKGFPIALTAFYASLLSVNYLISFYRFQRKHIDRNLIIARLFYLFDLFFAAFAPVVVLAYAYYNLHFDRAVYETKVETLPPGVYDRIARLYADPVEMSIFSLAFGSLRLTTASTIFTKCSLLFLSVFKWRKIIIYLIQANHLKQRQLSDHFPKVRKDTSSRRHLLCGMGLFVFFGCGIIMYTTGSIITSSQFCAGYKAHCVVISYHWIFAGESCPCLVYINRKMDPRTYDEWVNPPDAYDELAEVAKMGELKVIQVINRRLQTLPDSLKKCTKLEQLILLYTKTEIIPEWAKHLKELHYFHIEGDFTSSLTSLPRDTFLYMSKLSYLHTGIIPKLTSYPSLDGLVKLKTLAIAAPLSMLGLPSFDRLTNLRVLLLVEQGNMARLPSLQALKKLKEIQLFYRAAVCCNGFLTPGKCDLNNYQCLPRPDEPPVQCTNDSIPSADVAVLNRVGAKLCTDWTFDLYDLAPTRESTDQACGGIMFKKCQLGNATGICYNGRMQVVYCDTAGDFEKMRRLQIQRRVGLKCDTLVEDWLGCE